MKNNILKTKVPNKLNLCYYLLKKITNGALKKVHGD
jgi:hypothetical protein